MNSGHSASRALVRCAYRAWKVSKCLCSRHSRETRDADCFDLAGAFRMTFSGIGLAALLIPAQNGLFRVIDGLRRVIYTRGEVVSRGSF
jgi:hypothetical protein